MTEHTEQSQVSLDEPLASFTDLLLNGPAVAGSLAILAEEEDLRRLQQTVQCLHRAFGASQPDPAMAERIRKNLHAAWKESQPAAPRPTPLERLRRALLPERQGWQSGRRSQRVQALRFSLAAIAVLVLLLIVVPGTGSLITGTALGEGGWLPYAFLGVLIVGVAIWFWRSKPK